MKRIVKDTIDWLRERVKRNLSRIQENQKEIGGLIKLPASPVRTHKLNAKYAVNKTLLMENTDFINVQLTLSSFLEKYKDAEVLSDEGKIIIPTVDENECFENTINGLVEFDSSHPFFTDEKFFNRLLKYYEHLEDYEKCSQLMNKKQQ